MSGRIIFHLDMDQFFAAVEIHCCPQLRGRPVVVGGNPHGRGVVTTASYEARRFGVHAGMPSGEAYRLCPQAVFVKPDMRKYASVSDRVFDILRTFTDRVEPVSVDEAYLDVTDIVQREGGVEALATKIKRRILEEEGLTATIGAGSNRLVAKMASGMNKPDGFTCIPAGRAAEVFRDLPVGDLFGVGKATLKVLEGFGIRTAGQLAAFPADVLRRRFGKWGDELIRAARGEGSDLVRIPDERALEKSMSHEHTFAQDVVETGVLNSQLTLLCERLARRLRIAGMAGRCVSVKIRYQGFETVEHGRTLRSLVQNELDVLPVVLRLFKESYQGGRPVRLLGVQVSHLTLVSAVAQQELFVISLEVSDLASACDRIKDRFGEHAVAYASAASSGALSRRSRVRLPFSGERPIRRVA